MNKRSKINDNAKSPRNRLGGVLLKKTIERINQLYHKSQAEGLTDEEKKEQKRLRQRYLEAVKGNLQQQLESIRIEKPRNNSCNHSCRCGKH